MVHRVLDQKQPAKVVAGCGRAGRGDRSAASAKAHLPVIARRFGLPLSTVGGVLRRLGLDCLKSLGPLAPVVRYQRQRPGELVDIDAKKLGRIADIGHRITGRRVVHILLDVLPGSGCAGNHWSPAPAGG